MKLLLFFCRFFRTDEYNGESQPEVPQRRFAYDHRPWNETMHIDKIVAHVELVVKGILHTDLLLRRLNPGFGCV